MTRRSPRRAGAMILVSALVVALSATTAGPVGADPVITIDQPGAGQVLDSGSVTVSGRVVADSLYRISDLAVTVGEKTFTPACGDPQCSFSQDVSLPLNGSYQLKVSAGEQLVLGLGNRSADQTRTVLVAAPPQRPVLDPPRVADDRSVALSWGRNTEPDMLYYTVLRREPGAGRFLQIGDKVTQPTSGKSVSFIDTTTTFNGGDYAYQVVAVRKGAGGASPEVGSAPSSSGTASVPAPPITTTTPARPGSPAAGPSPTTKPGPPAGVDLGGFLSPRSSVRDLPPITVPEPPDTGFNNSLPFGARPPADDAEPGADQPAVPATAPRSVIGDLRGGRPLVPVAAGLLLLLLATHLRLLNRRIKPQAAAELPVDLVRASPSPAATPRQVETGSGAEAEAEREAVLAAAAVEAEAEREAVLAEAEAEVEAEAEREAVLAAAEADAAREAMLAEAEAEAEREAVLAAAEAEREAVLAAAEAWAPIPQDGTEYDEIEAPIVVNGGAPTDFGWDELEVFEVVSPPRRRATSAAGR